MKKKEKTQKKIRKKEDRKFNLLIILPIALAISVINFIYSKSYIGAIITFLVVTGLLIAYFLTRYNLKKSLNIRKTEDVFPDFLQLMSSNLRAGMTIDRALLLSSRREFAPLDKEISKLGKDLVTGKEITVALKDMSKRIGSQTIEKTVSIIVSGIKSGGDIAVLLEQTASNMRERKFIEKRAASNVLMYIIFIFFAISIGAPVLFGLSSVLVEVLTGILSDLPAVDALGGIAFTLTSINVSVTFIIYFSIIFIIGINILGALVMGIVSKGEEKAGIRYVVPLVILGITIFFVTRIVLLKYFSQFFGG